MVGDTHSWSQQTVSHKRHKRCVTCYNDGLDKPKTTYIYKPTLLTIKSQKWKRTSSLQKTTTKGRMLDGQSQGMSNGHNVRQDWLLYEQCPQCQGQTFVQWWPMIPLCSTERSRQGDDALVSLTSVKGCPERGFPIYSKMSVAKEKVSMR